MIAGCKKAYTPPAIASPGTFLVVEGFIDGINPTTIKLSNTVNLSDSTLVAPVLHASVSVQSDQNENYALTETTNGNYVGNGLNLNVSHKYRLSIKTAANKQYYSDYEPVLNSPPIDSVYYKITNDGININLSTHDATNTIQYYRWDYGETWIIHSNYYSILRTDGYSILPRDLINDDIYTCWQRDSSSSIVVASTARLSKAIVDDNLITSIGSTSEKLGVKYSILVKQYALTSDAYNFWANLKKNTEQLGSIFDTQPSQNNGNIHSSTNPSEQVVGFISVGNTSARRIFITPQYLPAWLPVNPYPNCKLDTFYYQDVELKGDTVNQVTEYLTRGPYVPVNAIIPDLFLPFAIPTGYTGSTRECVDCTLRGANKQPAFWE